MPNWCNNSLTLTHKDPAMITRASNALESGQFLAEFCPVPQDLLDTVAGWPDEDAQAEHEAQVQRNIALYGYGNWYDFCVANWGTKWDCGSEEQPDISPDGLTLSAYFDSAWSPPLAAYEKLEALGFVVEAMYYESGQCFAGIWRNGEDDLYSDWSDSKSARDVLPEELDDMFCISEQLSEIEEDCE